MNYTKIEASRLSIQFILGNIDGLLSDASNLVKQGLPVAKALSAMFTRDLEEFEQIESGIHLSIETY